MRIMFLFSLGTSPWLSQSDVCESHAAYTHSSLRPFRRDSPPLSVGSESALPFRPKKT